MLPPLKVVGFLLQRSSPPIGGLTSAPQAFDISGCPPAMGEMLKSLSDLVFARQSAARSYLEPFTRSRVPDRNRQGSVVNVQGANTCASILPRKGFQCNTTI
jgi:hypothetical protein